MKYKNHSNLLLSLLILLSCTARAQQNTVWNAFFNKTDVSHFTGMKFRMQAAVKREAGEKNSHAALWARVDKSEGKTGFFYNMNDRPITTDKWKIYKIEGKIDEQAKFLLIGGLFQENGIFCFDDFKLEIQNSAGKWEDQNIINAGFEQDSLVNWKFFQKNKFFETKIKTGNAFEKNHYMQITGSGILHKAEYGNNDSTGHFVKANRINIYYEEYGSGEPLLLLHGNSQNINSFSQQIPDFAKRFHVIAVDTRGHGKTSDEKARYTYDLFAADINALLNKLQLDSVNIVGWSDGGNTGLIMAMNYPKKVKRLVTMGAVIFIDSTVVTQAVLEEVKNQINKLKKSTYPGTENQLKKTSLLLEEPNHTYNDLKKIKCPVLVMAGENDIVKPEHTRGIAAAIANSKLYIAPKETHYLPQENPKEFNRLVMYFLSK